MEGIETRFPEVSLRGAFIDKQLSPSARSALAKFLRVPEDNVKALELEQQFPTAYHRYTASGRGLLPERGTFPDSIQRERREREGDPRSPQTRRGP